MRRLIPTSYLFLKYDARAWSFYFTILVRRKQLTCCYQVVGEVSGKSLPQAKKLCKSLIKPVLVFFSLWFVCGLEKQHIYVNTYANCKGAGFFSLFVWTIETAFPARFMLSYSTKLSSQRKFILSMSWEL